MATQKKRTTGSKIDRSDPTSLTIKAAGKTYTLREPTLGDLIQVEREAEPVKAGGVTQRMMLLGKLANASTATVGTWGARASGEVNRWLEEHRRAALKADGLDDQVADDGRTDWGFDDKPATQDSEAIADLDGQRSFDLLVPIDDGALKVEALTVTEPSLETLTKIESAKGGEMEVNAILIVECTRTSPRAIQQLTMRDANRLMMWLAPFVQDAAGTPTAA